MALEAHGAVFSIATGTGSAKDITAIILGAITEVTAVAHGFSAGDVVTFAAIVGTTELNGVSAIIIAKETDALFFGIDSSAYTAYTSGGTATPVTYTAVGEVTDWDGPGGAAAVIDITHLTSTAKEKLTGLMDEGQLTLSMNFLPTNTGQLAVQAVRITRVVTNFKLVYGDAVTTQAFAGHVVEMSSSGEVDGKLAGSITVEISGQVTLTP